LENIQLSSKITEIPRECFYNCKKLNNVILPSSITDIGPEAFSGCSSLNKIEIRGRITAISSKTFRDCTSLEEFVIPNSVESIWGGVFWGCTNLKKVVIPSSVREIGLSSTTPDMGRVFDDKNENLTVYVVKNSVAEMYAINNELNYELYEEPTLIIEPIANQVYTGTEIKPKLNLKYGKTTLQEGLDYILTYTNHVNVGKAKITITGIGYYKGTAMATFNIMPKSISTCSIQKAITDQSYTGKAIKPNPTIKNGKITLKNGTDYTVSYKNNTNCRKSYNDY